MEPVYVNIVLIQHPNNPGWYVFRAPDNVQLNVGDRVLCTTSRGNCQFGQCITPSFRIGDWQLEQLYGVTVKKLKPITHRLIPEAFGFCKPEDDEVKK